MHRVRFSRTALRNEVRTCIAAVVLLPQFPASRKRDLFFRHLQEHLLRRADEPAVHDNRNLRCGTHGNDIAPRAYKLTGNPVHPRLESRGEINAVAGPPDLDTVEIGDIAFIDRAQGERQLPSPALLRQFHSASEPEHPGMAISRKRPTVRKLHRFPVRIVIIRFGESSLDSFIRQRSRKKRPDSLHDLFIRRRHQLSRGKMLIHCRIIFFAVESLDAAAPYGIFHKPLTADPAFRPGSAQRCFYDADFTACPFRQTAGKEKRHAGKSARRLRGCRLPDSMCILRLYRISRFRNLEIMDGSPVQLAGRAHFRIFPEGVQRQFHVGLSGRQINFPDPDIMQNSFRSVRQLPDFEFKRPAGFERGQTQEKPAFGIADRHRRNTAERTAYPTVRSSLAPYGNGCSSLKNGMILK